MKGWWGLDEVCVEVTQMLRRMVHYRSVERRTASYRCDAVVPAEPGDSYWRYSAASRPFAYLELRVREIGKALAISWIRSA